MLTLIPHHYEMLTFLEDRDRHFLAALRKAISSLPAGEKIDIEALAMRVANSPAPAYYCTYPYALRMVRVLRHGRLTLRRDRRLALWTELNERASRLMRLRGIRLPHALATVLADGHASQFFISEATAVSLARQLLAGRTRTARRGEAV